MDKLTQRLLGIAAIIFAFAFLIRSFSPVQANHEPQTTYGTGKYMMSLQSMVYNGDPYWYILVWDTETGNSKFYFVSSESSMRPGSSEYQLPTRPL
ncbi:hypothetical protein [Aureispira sp. CCB-QB1]|uniref:hypothetical protein n=1 Tax=Aureispira sp. CCB-QB1 TaxID=1313421 RepID=UPI000697663A|nr:hypothetical protein [Aureispira sp. CCB-QB1]